MLKCGTQVALIPPYAKGSPKEKLKHRDTRKGVVTVITNEVLMCDFGRGEEVVNPKYIVELDS